MLYDGASGTIRGPFRLYSNEQQFCRDRAAPLYADYREIIVSARNISSDRVNFYSLRVKENRDFIAHFTTCEFLRLISEWRNLYLENLCARRYLLKQ